MARAIEQKGACGLRVDRDGAEPVAACPLLQRYVITRYENNRLEVLRVALDTGEDVLPVFSSLGIAQRFLISGGYAPKWAVRTSSSGEVVSLILGLCAGTGWVSLDPRPGLLAPAVASPNLARREDYVHALLNHGTENSSDQEAQKRTSSR